MPFRGAIRSLVERSTEEILAAAVEQGMRTMRQDESLVLEVQMSLGRGHRRPHDLVADSN